MKKLVLTALACATLSATAFAGSVISTGKSTGSYYKMGHKLSTFVEGSKVIKSKGSTQNLKRLMSGEAQYGIVQKDDYQAFIKKNPAAAEQVELAGDLKMECLYAVASTKSGITSDSQMQSKGVNIAYGKNGSGSQATWKYMSELEPKFKNAPPHPKGGSRALAGVASGKYDVALFMQTPSTGNKLVKTVLGNKSLHFVNVTDWDLNDKLPSGDPVYTHEKIDVASGFLNDTEIKTICTTASVAFNVNADEDEIDSVIDAILNNKNYILSK